MKKLLLTIAICSSLLIVQAQSIDLIKSELALQQYDKAKSEVDRAFTNGDFTKKAEAHLLKAAAYSSLAMSDNNRGTPAGDVLIKEAMLAFYKYREMEPAMQLLTDLLYQNAPINIYSSFYSSGYNDYESKKWQTAFEKITKAVEFSDLLIAKNLLLVKLDTNVLTLAGIIAENSGNKDDAAKYYARLADSGVAGDGFESMYRFLVSYFFGKSNMALFEKYKSLGGVRYPQSAFFKFDKVDFAVGLAESFAQKITALENILSREPGNYKANELMGELLYDTLNTNKGPVLSRDQAREWESKMVKAFTNAAAAQPNNETPYLYMGDHFINKAASIGEQRDAILKEIKAAMTAGVSNKPTSEQISKRDLLEKEYADALEAALVPYEKAAALLAGKLNVENTNQQLKNKQQYKKAVSYLADIYSYKKSVAPKNSPAFTNWEAQEKKWVDLYQSIK